MEILEEDDGEMPLPINSSYGGGHGHGHMIHHEPAPPHNHVVPCSTNGPLPILPISSVEDKNNNKKKMQTIIRYRECLKNHAASIGGNATDGCGEFMPSGEEGTLEALTCSACNCHRNFHRKETQGGDINSCHDCNYLTRLGGFGSRKLILGHHHHHHKGILGTTDQSFGYNPNAAGALVPSSRGAHHQMVMSYNLGSSDQSDDQEDGHDVHNMPLVPVQLVKKRFRTKFTQEQKDKMLSFAQKVGWKIQKQEESVVQQFCQQVGVKRRVLKVWMHNNKHNLAKNLTTTNPNIPPQNQI